MIWNKITLIIIFCFIVKSLFADGSISFIENKNQWPENVKYKLDLNNGAIFFENDKITYNFFKESDVRHSHAHHNDCKGHTNENKSINWHAYQINILNKNSNSTIISENPYSDKINYYLYNDKSKWASNVNKFNKIKYSDLYNNIDLIYYEKNGNLKYDFVVKANSDYKQIKLEYKGVDNLKIVNGKLLIKTSVNEITELQPYAYQLINGKQKEISCSYKLKNNIISFEINEKYDKSTELIIDPELIFSTYTGSTVDNWGFTATFDSDGNVFSGGIVVNVGYPVSLGAYQTTHAGIWDVGIIKYTSDGTNRIFATYLGGSGCEMPHSLVVNEFNELLIFGTTGSSNFPVTPNAYDQTFNGGTAITYDNTVTFPNGVDIYVSKLSTDGSALQASTYIGGSGNDGLNFKKYIDTNPQVLMHGNDSLYFNYADGARGEIITDGKNNVYVGSCTFSNDFPTTLGAFQQNSGGNQDGVVFKFDYNLSTLLWSTYLGGSSDDAIYSVETDSNFDAYVSGGTNSINFPTTPGAYNTTYNGGTADGFITHLSNNGNELVASTFFGSSTYDQVYFVRADKNDNIYITGQTKAPGNTLIYNATYNTPNSGQFIAKLNNSLTDRFWSTVFGTGNGKPNISITAFTVDVCNRVYISGWGREWAFSPPYDQGATIQDYWNSISGTKNMQVTSDAFQSTTDGQDFYIMVMSDDASSLDYATFFGEQFYSTCTYSGHDHVDGGTSRFDKKGNIYQSICASCGGCNAFPTFPNPGVWSPTNGASPNNNCNNAVFRFSFLEDFSIADFEIPPVGCSPYTVDFNNNSLGLNFHWDFGDGTTSTLENPTHTYTQSGTYDVTLIASDPSTCNLADTIIKQVQVLSNSNSNLQNESICNGESIQIGVDPSGNPSLTYSWIPTTGLSNSNISNPVASPTQTTQYILLISNGVCTDSIFQNVEIKQNNYNVNINPHSPICKGDTLYIIANSNSNTINFTWATDINFTNTISSSINDSTITVSPNNNTTYYILGNSSECNFSDIDSINIQVKEANILADENKIICIGDSIQLSVSNQITGDLLTYNWTPNNTIISGQNTANPIVKPTTNTNYIVEATNQYGCKDFDTITVNVHEVTINLSKTNVSCYGDCNGTINITAFGIPNYIYQWSVSGDSSSVGSLCEGTYTYTVTDSLGCKKTGNVIITQPSELMLSTPDSVTIACTGDCIGTATASVSGGTAPYSYLWDNNFSGQTVSNLCVGNHSVTVTDANGCKKIDNLVVKDLSNLSANILQTNNNKCYGDCIAAISVSAINGQAPYNYYWNNGSNNTSLSNLCSGFYYVSVIDAQNCVRVLGQFVNQPQQITSGINSGEIKCYGESANVTLSTTGGTAPFSYQWDDPNNQTSQTATNLFAGTYHITITDANNCKGYDTITLNQPSKLLANENHINGYCLNSCSGYINITPNGGTAPYAYLWSNGNTSNSDTLLCPGIYTITVTDNKGCSYNDTIQITSTNYIPPLDIEAINNIIFIGQSTQLISTNDTTYIYNWTPNQNINNTNIYNPSVNPSGTTTYQLAITDKNGCTNLDTITIIVKDFVCDEPFVFVPNAFTPNADGNNDELFVYSNIISSIYFAVYNRWGEQVFVTEDITKGWNGIYKDREADPAVYVYYLEATCIDNQKITKKGNVTLIR